MTMQTFKKNPNTGMHKSVFRAGSVVNGEKMANAGPRVVRPGNTVVCVAEDLGVSGLAQFTLISPPLPVEPEAPQKGIHIVPRGGGYFDVVNGNNPDQPLNEKGLRKEAAEEMLASLLNPEDVTDPGDSDITENTTDEDYTAYEWDALVGFLTDREVDIQDDWESDDDLRAALIALDKKTD